MKIVVKLGTSVLTSGTRRLNRAAMVNLAGQVHQLRQAGHAVALVSSGAIAAGREKLTLRHWLSTPPSSPVVDPPLRSSARRPQPETLVDKQVLAAIGQVHLMAVWQSLFEIHQIEVGQMLLTRADLDHRERFLNARDTLLGLWDRGALPIINENDAVATAEIKLGDNDNLSARVALLADADLLILLTDQPGLMTADPARDPQAQLLSDVRTWDAHVHKIAGGSLGGLGTGGMATKLQAAQIAGRGGVPVIIAAGAEPEILCRLVAGQSLGTRIHVQGSRLESRRRWLLSGPQSQGRLVLDEGACRAIELNKTSLLAKGITGVDGQFSRGDVVGLFGPTGTEIARGLVRYGRQDLQQILGRHSDEIQVLLGYHAGDAVVHRDEMIVHLAASP